MHLSQCHLTMMKSAHYMPCAICSVLRSVKKDERNLIKSFLVLKAVQTMSITFVTYHTQIKSPQKDSVTTESDNTIPNHM